MKKFLTDVHTHSTYSHDGKSTLREMLSCALEKGIAFYGVSEHFDFDSYLLGGFKNIMTDEEEYFHGARHLQEDYEGCMNVLIGAEFGYADDERVLDFYKKLQEKYKPDFVVNSIHTLYGNDYYFQGAFYRMEGDKKVLKEKEAVYKEYLRAVRESLDAPFDYDIVGHVGYVTRYAPYEDKSMRYADYAKEIDDILQTIIQKGKILEINTSRGKGAFLPTEEILRRYYALGGRAVSYGSDAHSAEAVGNSREEAVALLKDIGFTHITVPCKGEYIKVEI